MYRLIVYLESHAEDDGALLVSMWVHPEHRGAGVGDTLVGAVKTWARDEGKAALWLHVDKADPRARRFYERNGFVATGTEIRRERDGAPELEMRCPLPAPAP